MCFAKLLNPFQGGTTYISLSLGRREGSEEDGEAVFNFYLSPHSMLMLHDFLYNLMGRFLLL